MEAEGSGDYQYIDETGYENVDFYYKVRAVLPAANGDLTGGWSNAADALTYRAVPAPTGLTARSTGDGEITLTWTGVADTRYDVYRYNSTLGQYVFRESAYPDAEGKATFFEGGLYPGVTYYYKVRAVQTTGDGEAESSFSAAAYATASNGFKIPDGFAAENAGDRAIAVTWAPVPEAVAYRVYRYNSTLKRYVLKATVDAPLYKDENVYGGISYYYRVSAVFSENGTEEELSRTFVTKAPCKPYAPQSVAAETADRGVTVTWSAVNGATGYEVYRWNSTLREYVLKAAVEADGNSFTDDTAFAGVTWYYKVKAVFNDGTDTWFSVFSAGGSAAGA